MRSRSVELEVPDRESAVRFFRDTWGLLEAGERNGISYLRGTEDIPYVVSVVQTNEPGVAAITFSGSKPELAKIRKRAAAAGAPIGPLQTFDEPGGGSGYLVQAPERSEEHTSELQSLTNLVCRLLLGKKKQIRV